MPKIPEAIDFGARPAQQSRRGVDAVDRSELIIGESIQNAANQFAAVLSERKQKQDRVNYAIAKADFLAADLDARESLKDDEDWDTFDVRYKEAMSAALDNSGNKIRSKDDLAIFQAESQLITARGAAQVSELRRQVEGDEKISDVLRRLAEGKERILNADPGTRNAMLMNDLDMINGLEQQGLINDVQARARRQEHTQDVATASLAMMPVSEQIEALKTTLAYRKGQPLTVDDIKEDKGTGSIADFIHTDTARKLLEDAEAENKVEEDRQAAYTVADAAAERSPENFADQMKYVRKNLKGTQRSQAEEIVRARERDEEYAEKERRDQRMTELTSLLDGGKSPSELPTNMLSKLTATEKLAIDNYYESKMYDREGFASIAHPEAIEKWMDMSVTQRVKEPLGSAQWKAMLDPGTWSSWKSQQQRERDALQNADATKAASLSVSLGKEDINGYLDQKLFGHGGFGFDVNKGKPSNTGPDGQAKKYARYRRIQNAVFMALWEAEDAYPEKKLPRSEQLKVIDETLSQQVYLRENPWGWNDWRSDAANRSDEPIMVAELTPEQEKEALVPIEIIKSSFALDADGDVRKNTDGSNMTIYDELVKIAEGQQVDDYNDRDLEEVFYYYKFHGRDAAIKRLKDRKKY